MTLTLVRKLLSSYRNDCRNDISNIERLETNSKKTRSYPIILKDGSWMTTWSNWMVHRKTQTLLILDIA